MKTPRQAAEGLFKRPEVEEESNAAKLQGVRNRQAVKAREEKLVEIQQRLEKRNANSGKTGNVFR